MSRLAGITGPTAAVLARAAREGGRDPGPSMLLPALPSLLMAVAFTAQFDRLNGVIDFPTGSFDEYLVPGLLLFVGLAGGGFTSAQLAMDLRTGFMDRLRLQLDRPVPLLLGRYAFEALRVLPGALAVVALGVALGGSASNGLPGVAAAVALTMAISAAYAGVFYVVAVVTRDPQTPLNLQPAGIILFFLSSAVVPSSAMPRWAETVANLNPVTAIADGIREAMIGDLASADVGLAAALAALLLALSIAGSSRVLARTIDRS
jgi:ABC-2 type transport system permease protein